MNWLGVGACHERFRNTPRCPRLIGARSKVLKERQESDLKKVKSYKGNSKAAKDLLTATKAALKNAKTERKGIITKLLKAQDAVGKKKS